MNEQSKNARNNAHHREYVTKSLASHSVRLEYIKEKLDWLVQERKENGIRLSKVENGFSFFKGITYFLMGTMGVLISLLAVIK